MPYYDYTCSDCNRSSQIKMSISEKESGKQIACPECGSMHMEQSFEGIAVLGARSVSPGASVSSRSSGKVGPCGHACACAHGN